LAFTLRRHTIGINRPFWILKLLSIHVIFQNLRIIVRKVAIMYTMDMDTVYRHHMIIGLFLVEWSFAPYGPIEDDGQSIRYEGDDR